MQTLMCFTICGPAKMTRHSAFSITFLMNLSLSVKYRNARSHVSLKESSTVGSLKSEINVS